MKRFSVEANPVAVNIAYEKKGCRISVLTPCLVRVEKDLVTDLPTQTVWNRDLGVVAYEVEEKQGKCIIKTEEAVFTVDIAKAVAVSVILKDGTMVTDFDSGNLMGTARTLDNINGSVKLAPGILSRSGACEMDDSKSLLLEEDGKILPRPECSDRYYFAYGHDYLRQLKDFFRLTGPVPLIPKFALGNWWSRYKAYTQEEYRALMQEFADRKLPITVATIDMDWHWTDVVERFGAEAKPAKPKCKEEVLYNTLLPGWTGYTWNTELFPDHKELLNWLHEHGLYVTVNVHPSQGIRFYEDCYEAFCKRMGKDPTTKEYIPFDITDENFLQAYFEEAHHPYEEEGVDFWWLDWQQGTKTNIPGLDPLWALNHYHTLDKARDEKRPLILSRYAGLGSHRYPLGFSGDTICTWKSLAFQPYFTANASNAGYTWWSHDIGGHMRGIQDDELYLRWLQFGVFSPINRLHSSNSDFMGKEPWRRSWAVARISEDFLRLRHQLIPYLYSANYRTHTEGEPLCMPMYYRYDCEDAYAANDQYLFGGQLLVCPITKPADKRLNLAYADVWLPEGTWTDIFNGRVYEGGRWVKMYRDLDSIPVLAPAGAIVPMYSSAETNDLSLEQPLEIHVWQGNGYFELYEDDGETSAYRQGKQAITTFTMEQNGKSLRLTIQPPKDAAGLLPEQRKMRICFRDIPVEDVWVTVGQKPVTLEVKHLRSIPNPPVQQLRMDILTRVQGENDWKSMTFGKEGGRMPKFVQDALSELDALK